MSLQLKLSFSDNDDDNDNHDDDDDDTKAKALQNAINAVLDATSRLQKNQLQKLHVVMTTIKNLTDRIDAKREELILAQFRFKIWSHRKDSMKTNNFYDMLYTVDFCLSNTKKSCFQPHLFVTFYNRKIEKTKQELAILIQETTNHKIIFRNLCHEYLLC